MNKTMIKTAGLVLAAAMAASVAFASPVTPSSSSQEKATLFSSLQRIEVLGTVVDYNSGSSLLTIKTYNNDTITVNVNNNAIITVFSEHTDSAVASDLSTGQTVKVYVDGNLNAKNIILYDFD